MSENYNIQAHYTNNPKVVRPKIVANNSPQKIPNDNRYEPDYAKKRLAQANAELNVKYKKEERKDFRNFVKGTTIISLLILGLLALKKVLKKS